MKQYFVIDKLVFAGESKHYKKGETMQFLIGKRFVHRFENLEKAVACEMGWSRKRFAEDYIKKQSEWAEKHEPWWKHEYEIYEAEMEQRAKSKKL